MQIACSVCPPSELAQKADIVFVAQFVCLVCLSTRLILQRNSYDVHDYFCRSGCLANNNRNTDTVAFVYQHVAKAFNLDWFTNLLVVCQKSRQPTNFYGHCDVLYAYVDISHWHKNRPIKWILYVQKDTQLWLVAEFVEQQSHVRPLTTDQVTRSHFVRSSKSSLLQ